MAAAATAASETDPATHSRMRSEGMSLHVALSRAPSVQSHSRHTHMGSRSRNHSHTSSLHDVFDNAMSVTAASHNDDGEEDDEEIEHSTYLN